MLPGANLGIYWGDALLRQIYYKQIEIKLFSEHDKSLN